MPPWHRGLALETHCIGCAQPCVSSCDPGIIRVHPPNHDYADIPYLDFTTGGCTFCQACVEACPIDIAIADKATPSIGTLTINRKSCIAWQDIICVSCSHACDYKAITTSYQRRPRVDTMACTGCGRCVPVCPVKALTVTPLSS